MTKVALVITNDRGKGVRQAIDASRVEIFSWQKRGSETKFQHG